MKVTIIGAGNMGGATARGLLASGAVAPADLTIVDVNQTVRMGFEALGVGMVTGDARSALARPSDVVILAVKPWLMKDLLRLIADVLCDRILVSMAAGVDLAELKAEVRCPVVRVIPNTAIEVGESMSFIYTDMYHQAKELQVVCELYGSVGRTMVVRDEKVFAGMMALSSCGIAYALRYVRAAMEGGVELGVAPALGREVVAQTLRGAAELLLRNQQHPEVEIDKVTTPGGVTIRGLNAMEQHGFTNAVIQGLKASK